MEENTENQWKTKSSLRQELGRIMIRMIIMIIIIVICSMTITVVVVVVNNSSGDKCLAARRPP